MEAKHIAGPWIAQANPDSIDIEGHKRTVAVVPGTDDEAIDISRLIAAAPDLLAALEIAWRWQCSDLGDEDEILNIMALAIAKATGKEAGSV